MKNRMQTLAAAALLLAGAQAQAITMTWVAGPSGSAQGLTYTLTGTSVDSDTWSFVLGIAGINLTSDREKGRTSLSDLAFTQPTGYQGATMGSLAAINGGLNAQGCNTTGDPFFCFDNFNAAVSGSTMSLTFTIDTNVNTSADAAFAHWSPDIKVDWAGTKKNSNYDNVSQIMVSTVPEPTGAALLLAGLATIGAAVAWRRRPVQPGALAAGH